MSQVVYVAINLQSTWVKTMNECVHFRTDLFDSVCQSDLLTLIAIKFDEKNSVSAYWLNRLVWKCVLCSD